MVYVKGGIDFDMHAEIETILRKLHKEGIVINEVALYNAHKLLNYIEDINLERKNKFELTPADSLYLLWEVDKWEIHIECLDCGKILYTFRRNGVSKAFGKLLLNDFINLLERYLLTGIC